MAAVKKADPSGKPPPDVAAILELLNEIKRELTADATETPPPVARALAEPGAVQPPPVTPIPPIVAPPAQAAAPEPPKTEPPKPELPKIEPTKAEPPKPVVPNLVVEAPPVLGARPFLAPPILLPDTGPLGPAATPPAAKARPRIGMGITLAIVYVVIFAAAGLVISRWMHSRGVQVTEQPMPATAPPAVADNNDNAVSPLPKAPETPAPPAKEIAQAPVVAAPAPPPPPVVPPPEVAKAPEPASPPAAAPSPPPPPQQAAKTPEPVAPPVPVAPAVEAPPVTASAPVKAPPEPVAQVAPPPAAVAPPPPVAAAPPFTAPSANNAVAALNPPANGAGNRTAPPAASAPDAEALRAQGDDSLRHGDISTARLFYQRAAEAGDGEAALLLGHTYNPDFLSQLGVRGLRGDLAQAALWYRRARDLGDKDADIALRSLPTH